MPVFLNLLRVGRFAVAIQSLALTRLMEDHLYWCLLYDRWVDEDNWPGFRKTVFKELPPIIGGFIARLIRKQSVRDAHGQGLSRHGRERVMAFGIEDLKAAEAILGDKTFTFGDKPTSADATLASSLAFVMNPEFVNPMYEFVASSPTLLPYHERVQRLFFQN